MTALIKAFGRWTGQRTLLVDLEGHGREDLFGDVDLSRTVGWFTTMFPAFVDIRGKSTPGDELMAVKEQIRRIPRHGMSFGLLRYLCKDAAVRQDLSQAPVPEIGFNYLGQFDQGITGSTPFRPAPESGGPERSPRAHRSHLLEIS